MNIFILDKDMQKNAMYHTDKHIVKMPVEATQLLCNTYWAIGELPLCDIYKSVNINHPCSKWARESLANWKWLRFFTLELGKEYKYRYGRDHASVKIAEQLTEPNIADIGLTEFAKCVPNELKGLSVIEAYRQYFINYKQHLKVYTNRNTPDWWTN